MILESDVLSVSTSALDTVLPVSFETSVFNSNLFALFVANFKSASLTIPLLLVRSDKFISTFLSNLAVKFSAFIPSILAEGF